ncbi:MAG: ATP-grasp fold amidoligase family protein [Bacilli bacterium]|nr:ATP-grasp fold amidoligase family protein [Clostridium sp.]MDY2804243.1 ATP-grasp fold amidoligase family protein [Bacilli bacterium]
MKNKLLKLKYYLLNPSKLVLRIMNSKFSRILADKTYLKIYFKCKMGYKLNLKNPQTFNEKLQWLKLYDRNPEYTKMVDKYEVREYIKEKIGEEYLIPLIGVYDKFDDIDFDELPNQFVIKCNHDSGGLVICKDKGKLNIEETRKKINKSLKRNYYYSGREWPYKNVKPRIIIEKYMEDSNKSDLIDYKLFCFNGIPKIVLVCSERFSSSNMCETWFDMNWKLIDMTESGHRVDSTISKPKQLKKMVELSKKLSKNIPFIRVDWYEIGDKLYFGELTFYPASGFEKFEPKEWNKKIGDMLSIDKLGVK